jgi:flagellar biosynthesis protein FliR
MADSNQLLALPVEPLIVAALVFARLGGLMLMMPGFANVPRLARLGVILPLTLILYPVAEAAVQTGVIGALQMTLPVMVAGMAVETGIGMSMGMVMSVVVSTMTIAGEVASVNIGLHISAMLDPLTGNRGDAISSMTSMMGIGLFLTTDTHLHCIAILGESLRTLPPGALFEGALSPGLAVSVMMQAAVMAMRVGVALAGPVIAFAFLIHLAISLLGRMAPNLNLFFSIGMSLNVVAGTVILMVAMPTIAVSFLPMLRFGTSLLGQMVGL